MRHYPHDIVYGCPYAAAMTELGHPQGWYFQGGAAPALDTFSILRQLNMAMEHPPFMVINGDLMGCHGDLMGFHGGWMGSSGD